MKIIKTSILSFNYIIVLFVLLDLNDWIKEFGLEIDKKYYLVVMLLWIISVIVIQFFIYGGFKLYKHDDYFLVENGIIATESNEFKTDNIMGLSINENLGMRILKLVTISAIFNGKNNSESKTKNIILPYIEKKTFLNC